MEDDYDFRYHNEPMIQYGYSEKSNKTKYSKWHIIYDSINNISLCNRSVIYKNSSNSIFYFNSPYDPCVYYLCKQCRKRHMDNIDHYIHT